MASNPDFADNPHRAGWLIWLITWSVCWFALARVIRFQTPIDIALPWIGALLLIVAASTRASIAYAIPLLALTEILLVDERVRFLAFGVIVASAVVSAVATGSRIGTMPSVVLTVVSIVILRWIPMDEVSGGREVVLLLLSALTTAVLGGGPFAVAVAVVTALFTPLVPLRTFVLPVLVLMLAGAAQFFAPARVRFTIVPALVVGAILIFFPWSGVVARALPSILGGLPKESPRLEVNAALPAASSIELDVPDRAVALIVSGANVPRLRRGDLLGMLEPGHRAIRIGDVADWGALRREHIYASRNPWPRDPAGRVRGYGYSAWIDGAGRIKLPAGARRIRVTAAPVLPRGASLQIEGFEVARP